MTTEKQVSKEGFIILNENGWHLSNQLYWLQGPSLDEAYVHPQESIEIIRKQFQKLQHQLGSASRELVPRLMIRADWNEAQGIVAMGSPEAFPGLDEDR